MIGRTLSHYTVLEKIGSGGMGEVYLARDNKLHREVAIKILPEAFAENKERLARFEREARVLASLNHPNIAAIHELEESDGVHFLATIPTLPPSTSWKSPMACIS
jgi:serine/threonine protein kinase